MSSQVPTTEKHQRIPAKEKDQQIDTGDPARPEIQSHQPHTGWQERKCSRMLPVKKTKKPAI